jgi:hypothetical protein
MHGIWPNNPAGLAASPLARCLPNSSPHKITGGHKKVSKKILTILAVAMLAVSAGCNQTDNANATATNVNATAPTTTTRAGADNSEITTTTDANGVTTETRVFKNNPRVSRVVVTTDRSGRRTTRVYSPSGTEKVVDNIGNALDETGDAIANAAGWTVEKTKEGATEVGDKLEDVKDETAKGAKKVGKKTAEGAKKAGKAIKDAVTP